LRSDNEASFSDDPGQFALPSACDYDSFKNLGGCFVGALTGNLAELDRKHLDLQFDAVQQRT
jgi:hypothetical protein